MRCGSNDSTCTCNAPIRSWYDLENRAPKNPFDLIAFAQFAGVNGEFEYSTEFLGTNGATTPLSLAAGGSLGAWGSDSGQKMGDADMWTMQHKMVNVSNLVPPPLHKLAFLRGGMEWKNTLLVDVGIDLDYVMLSFLENAGTRGDAQGTVPVIRFDGPITAGQHALVVTLKTLGEVSMGQPCEGGIIT